MREDIRALRSQCDVLITALHMGLHFEETLHDYEYHIPREAINAGSDLIVVDNAHCLKAMEFYRGVPIYHCLGNLVTVFPWNIHGQYLDEPDTTTSRSRIRPRAGTNKSSLNMDRPNYPFPDHCLNSMIASIHIDADTKKISQVGFIPVKINNEGQPLPVGNDKQGGEVVAHMEKITKNAQLNTKYTWDDNEVIAAGG